MCVIAIDYDNTISADFQSAREAIKTLQSQGHFIVIWSSRNNKLQHGEKRDSLMNEMEISLAINNISFDAIDYGYNGKYHAQVYIDDKAIRFENNWDEIVNKIY